MEDFLPALFIIVWVALNILGVIGKRKKKSVGDAVPQQKSGSGKGFLKELTDQIKQMETQATKKQAPNQQIKTTDTYKSPKQEYKSLADQVDLDTYEPISAEILETPYSNLEKGILDERHKSKFSHHGGKKIQLKPIERPSRRNIFKKVSPKDAFVYSLIFDPKHFKQL